MRNYGDKVYAQTRLSREEEWALWEGKNHGELARRYLPYAIAYVDRRYKRVSVSTRDDLRQAAALGLIHAVSRFDHTRNCAFTTYAQWWVAAYVRKHRYKHLRVVSLGASAAARQALYAYFRVGTPSSEDLQGLGIELEDADTLAQVFAQPEREYTESPALNPAPDALIEPAQLQAVILRYLDGLPVRERTIILRRHLADDPCLQEELAQEFGVSRQRVAQLEIMALKKLRGWFRRDHPEYAPPLPLEEPVCDAPNP